ncbi:MAG: hypothetical protein K2Y32_14330 [Candidatus Obscuribacterales bacterium]|nr:hypothetical protein [Candidatus Obscuribacterales bacterium]
MTEERNDRVEAKKDSPPEVVVPDLTHLFEEVYASGKGSKRESAKLNTADLNYLQESLVNLLPAMQKDGSTAALEKQHSGLDLSAMLQSEKDSESMGPITKGLYRCYVDWLEKKALPQELERRRAYGLDLYESPSFDSSSGKVSLKVEHGDVPSAGDISQLKVASRWLSASIEDTDVKERVLIDHTSKQLSSSIKDSGLPRGWLPDTAQLAEHDKVEWLKNTMGLMQLATDSRRYITLMDDLSKASKGLLPFALPPGATVDRDGGGRIVTLNLNLPQSWRLDSPQDKERLLELEKWLADKKRELDPLRSQLEVLKNTPELMPANSDLELKNKSVLLSTDGQVQQLFSRNTSDGKGKDVNLMESRLQVENKDGKVILHQSLQFRNAPVWGYLNLVGVEDVGKPIELTRTYNPDDLVVLRHGHEYSVVKASQLESDGIVAGVKRFGEKALPAAMDAGLVMMGAAETAASLRRPSGGALSLVNGWQLARGLTHTTVGATGIFNSAGARETAWGENLGTARSAYFLAMAGYMTTSGLARTFVPRLKSLVSRPLAVSAAEGSEATAATMLKTFHGPEGKLLRPLYKGGALTTYTSGLMFSPYIAGDLLLQTSRSKLENDPTRLLERQARHEQ